MLGIVGFLPGAAAVSLVHGRAHGGGHLVRVEQHPAGHVARGPAEGLHQGLGGAQKALLVRVQDGHQGHLRDVQALAQQVDAHQHVELAGAQGLDDGHPLQGVDVRVQVARGQAAVLHELGEVLGHALGERGHQHPVPGVLDPAALAQQVVHLAGHGTDLDEGVHQAGGPDDLLGHQALAALQLPGARGGGHVDHLVEVLQALVEVEGPVVQGRGQAEPVVHQGLLARAVAVEHAPHLGQGHVGLVHEQDEVLGEVVQERGRRLPRGPAVQVAGIVLDAVAVAQLLDHLQVQLGALLQALGLHQLVGGREVAQPLAQLGADVGHGPGQVLPVGHVVAGREDHGLVQGAQHLAGQGVGLGDGLQLVAKEGQAQGAVLAISRDDLQHVAAHPERAAVEVHVVALVVDLHQAAGKGLHVQALPGLHRHHHLGVVLWRAQAVDAGHRGHDEHVAPGQQGVGRGVAELLDLVVDGRVFFYVEVRMREIGLGLVVVVVGHEVFHRVVREELAELVVELGGQGLVGGQHQGRPVHRGHHPGHGEGLARAGDAQEHLVAHALPQAGHDLGNGLGLVAGGRVRAHELEGGVHGPGFYPGRSQP